MSDALMAPTFFDAASEPAAANDSTHPPPNTPEDGFYEGSFGPLGTDGRGAHVQIPTHGPLSTLK